ncbi:maleylpyruvate isomerase family mycothiol-dependent enzyme [Kribbella qitaiheensis]|uniref:Maleylpyruvate isomerase family mycothiol-dependent enzyme n=1 Tax=Kribbella qitaiheensis TaxID=1544730 RepID=A0A7G6WUS3_9ACTN|nr:maleylpyruvate isomerase family mycothiol-dependent enzyme [Kribbella qitaiheensis]QNE17738.1 maleylpyruvate isomerase family mycothiol-dependent enzyme [Kribbella qitaiheensis]
MSMPPERAAFYLSCLRADSERFAEVARLGLAADVPACPGWTVEDVVRHLATVYLHKVEILRLGALPDPWPPEFGDRDLLDLYDEARASVVTALEQAGTDLTTWTFSPYDSTSAFWYRRMALETAVHRVDIEQAHGVPTPIDSELAVDGIDEILTLMLGGPWWAEGDTKYPVDATIRITTEGRSWTIRLDATSATVTPGSDGDVDAEVFGDPNEIYLWLWGRGKLNLTQAAGDDQAVEAFRSRMAETTT